MEEIYNKWLEMIEEDEKRDGISMLEPKTVLGPCAGVEESKYNQKSITSGTSFSFPLTVVLRKLFSRFPNIIEKVKSV